MKSRWLLLAAAVVLVALAAYRHWHGWLGGSRIASHVPQPAPDDLQAVAPPGPRQPVPADSLAVARRREQLDRTLWVPEVEAQRYEEPIVQLWDRLRATGHDRSVLGGVPLEQIVLGSARRVERLELGIERLELAAPTQTLRPEGWRAWLDRCHELGYRLVESEWHHARFEPDRQTGPRSVVRVILHVENTARQERWKIHGDLAIDWTSDGSTPRPRHVDASGLRAERRRGSPPFHLLATLRPSELERQHFLAAYDLDRDGLPEIIFGNQVYRYTAEQTFRAQPLAEYRPRALTGALLADFTGDGLTDLLCADPGQQPQLYVADKRAAFSSPPRIVTSIDPVRVSMAMTAGDVNGDGHLDVWLTQYLNPYHQGRMPAPYYNANDGPPAYLLLGDGQGGLRDATHEAGLTTKRFRRTYSSSLADLDGDHDLDLLVVSDFAGVDLYRNDGRGKFHDVTQQWLDEWHNFGMSHTLADFDGDGQLDFYVTGMASTTARRLESLGVGRSDLPEHTRMRAVMGYGNRMYLARGSRFVQPEYRQQVARTGWSWGSTALDFDNDGDRDLYVGNGHISGPSARDYCSIFWRHDIYAGSAPPNPGLPEFFTQLHRQFQQTGSWNGYEHNCLLMNQAGSGFLEVGFLLGVASEFDTRNVVAADVDGDGRVDLLVAEHPSQGPARLHIYQNRGSYSGHWLGVVLAESAGRTAMGAKVTLHTPRGRLIHHVVSGDSFNSQHPLTAHFGLGPVDRVDWVEIRWPDGTVARLDSPPVDQYHRGG